MNLVWAAEVQYNIHIGNMDKTQVRRGEGAHRPAATVRARVCRWLLGATPSPTHPGPFSTHCRQQRY